MALQGWEIYIYHHGRTWLGVCVSPQIPQFDPMFTQSCNDSFIISLCLPGKLGDVFSNKKSRNRKPKYWDPMTPASLCNSNLVSMNANKPFFKYFYLQKLENPPNQILKASCFGNRNISFPSTGRGFFWCPKMFVLNTKHVKLTAWQKVSAAASPDPNWATKKTLLLSIILVG